MKMILLAATLLLAGAVITPAQDSDLMVYRPYGTNVIIRGPSPAIDPLEIDPRVALSVSWVDGLWQPNVYDEAIIALVPKQRIDLDGSGVRFDSFVPTVIPEPASPLALMVGATLLGRLGLRQATRR